MRHQRKRHKLGRTAAHRKATLAALSTSLIAHKRITTTVAKAKALRGYIEPLITRAKEDSQHNRRQVFRHLQDNHAVSVLFTDVAEQVGDRPGGYTRVVKLGRRAGDGASLAMIELVDYNDVKPDEAGGRSRRTRRGSGKGRRRSKAKGAAKADMQQTDTRTETAKQVETAEKGVETDTVEESVSEEQAAPATERTEAGDVPEEQIEAAEDAIAEQQRKAEAEAAKAESRKDAPEATAKEDAPEAETDAPETEAETDAPEGRGEAEAKAGEEGAEGRGEAEAKAGEEGAEAPAEAEKKAGKKAAESEAEGEEEDASDEEKDEK